MTIIHVYAPTIDAEEKEVDEFYHQVQFDIDPTYQKDVLLMTTNWNTKVRNSKE